MAAWYPASRGGDRCRAAASQWSPPPCWRWCFSGRQWQRLRRRQQRATIRRSSAPPRCLAYYSCQGSRAAAHWKGCQKGCSGGVRTAPSLGRSARPTARCPWSSGRGTPWQARWFALVGWSSCNAPCLLRRSAPSIGTPPGRPRRGQRSCWQRWRPTCGAATLGGCHA